jgi:UDP-arabinose 4-epimerase
MASTSPNILVAGGAGYIGSHVSKALAGNGFLPVAYDNLSTGNRWAVRWGPLVEGDIGDKTRVADTLRKYDIGGVIHLAAFAYVGESVTAPERYFENNVIQSLAFLEAVRAAGVDIMVFSSSCATYGAPGTALIAETTPQIPINPYGETKLFMERALHWYRIAHGFRSVSLRYFNAAGADPDGEIGEHHVPETHLVPLLIDAALGHRVFEVYGSDHPTPDGTCVRDFVHVTDLAEGHVKALRYVLGGGDVPAFNLGTGIGCSVRDMIRIVEAASGRSIPFRMSPRRPGDPATLVADIDLARTGLYWAPKFSTPQTICETAWNWHLSRDGIDAA